MAVVLLFFTVLVVDSEEENLIEVPLKEHTHEKKTNTDNPVTVIFTNESGLPGDLYWAYRFEGGHKHETRITTIQPNESHAEKTHADQQFYVKFGGKIGDAFLTNSDRRQEHTIRGMSNQMSHRQKEL